MREKISVVQRMVNRDKIIALAKQWGIPARDLVALAERNDPFLCGTAGQVESARWFGDLWERFGFSEGMHLRRIHYRLVSCEPPVLHRENQAYLNTEGCWQYLCEASKAARYLGYVDPRAFVDRRNPTPELNAIFEPHTGLEMHMENETAGVELEPFRSLPLPCHRLLWYPAAQQSYLMEVWVEKSTVSDVVAPLCSTYETNLIIGAGEMSLTAAESFLTRVEAADRPAVILYVSDYDPAGQSMPLATARKIEYTIQRRGVDVDVKVYPVALLEQQARSYELPRTPIKQSERRRDAFESRHGAGATELDALEALHPGELRAIIANALDRYRDHTLEARFDQHYDEQQSALTQLHQEAAHRHSDELNTLRDEYEKIRSALEAWRVRADDVWRAIGDDLKDEAPDVHDIEATLPTPHTALEEPEPLFDSQRSYMAQLDCYKQHQGKLHD